jgi:hypothetical protein
MMMRADAMRAFVYLYGNRQYIPVRAGVLNDAVTSSSSSSLLTINFSNTFSAPCAAAAASSPLI